MVNVEEGRHRTPLVDAMLARRGDTAMLFLPFAVIASYAAVLALQGLAGIVIVILVMGVLTLVTGLVFWWLVKQLSIDTEYEQQAFGSSLEEAVPRVERALEAAGVPWRRVPLRGYALEGGNEDARARLGSMGRKGLLARIDATVLFDLEGGKEVVDVTEHVDGEGALVSVTLWPATAESGPLFARLLEALREELPPLDRS